MDNKETIWTFLNRNLEGKSDRGDFTDINETTTAYDLTTQSIWRPICQLEKQRTL